MATLRWDRNGRCVPKRARRLALPSPKQGGGCLDSVGVLLAMKAFGIAFGVVLARLVAPPSLRRGGVRLAMVLGIAIALSDGVGSQVLRRMFART